MEEKVTMTAAEQFEALGTETKNVLVCNHLRSLSRWDLKRILCNVLDVDNYMDDGELQSKVQTVIFER